MRGYVHSDDLEPGSRRGGAAARLAGCAGTRVAMHNTQPYHTSTKLPVTAHPCQHLGSAPNSVEISSIGGPTEPQQIRAQRHPDPPQSHQNCLRQFGHSSNPPLLPSTTHPRQHLGTPQDLAGTSSKTSATCPRQIRTQRQRLPSRYHPKHPGSTRGFYGAHGHLEQRTRQALNRA